MRQIMSPITIKVLCVCADDQSARVCKRKKILTCIAFFCIYLCVLEREGVSDQSICVCRLLIRLTPEPRAAPLGDCG